MGQSEYGGMSNIGGGGGNLGLGGLGTAIPTIETKGTSNIPSRRMAAKQKE